MNDKNKKRKLRKEEKERYTISTDVSFSLKKSFGDFAREDGRTEAGLARFVLQEYVDNRLAQRTSHVVEKIQPL